MGKYLNPGSRKFNSSLKSKIYVDKSELIAKLNPLIDTDDRYVCVSRPRRFGKTMAANMLAAYYGRGIDSTSLFDGLSISKFQTYESHVNQYDCIAVNIQEFLSRLKLKNKKDELSVEDLVESLNLEMIGEVLKHYPDVDYSDPSDFIHVFYDAYIHNDRQFVILIDEWDCIFREYKEDLKAHVYYLDFLRLWLKTKNMLAWRI